MVSSDKREGPFDRDLIETGFQGNYGPEGLFSVMGFSNP
jgi:hypothetical protein